jgi:hypothetical protein
MAQFDDLMLLPCDLLHSPKLLNSAARLLESWVLIRLLHHQSNSAAQDVHHKFAPPIKSAAH